MQQYYFKVEIDGFDGERLVKVSAINEEEARIKVRKSILDKIILEPTTPEKESCKKNSCNNCPCDDPTVNHLKNLFGMK